ncbi:MAG: spermidine/putrescine ABC transporter substrate-binding protein [Thermoplasmatota archaeon]
MMKKSKSILIIVILLLISIAGCVQNDTEKQDETISSVLNVFNWDDYLAPNLTKHFEEQYNVTVNVFTFEEEGYMISELETNPGSYDFVITSGSMVEELIATKSLAKLNKDNIPNIKNIDQTFLNRSFDPGNTYSIPYLWGTTGIAYNTSAITTNISSWSILWNKTFQDRIGMIDNKQEVIGAALKYLGYSLNPDNISQIYQAEQLLLDQKDIILGYFGSEETISRLVSGNLSLAHCYSGDAYFASDMNENISYVIPSEGAAIWIDNMVIPVDSPHKTLAELFINYILDPQISANITNYQWYANPNTAAEPFIDTEILETAGLYPSQDVLDQCEFFEPLPGNLVSEYNRIWSLLKTEIV